MQSACTDEYSGKARFARNLTATSVVLTGNSAAAKMAPSQGGGEVH